MLKVIQSNDPSIDTLKCPKCGVVWRAKGDFEFGYDRWVYEGEDDEFCPRGCVNFLGFRISGKILK